MEKKTKKALEQKLNSMRGIMPQECYSKNMNPWNLSSYGTELRKKEPLKFDEVFEIWKTRKLLVKDFVFQD